MLPHARVGAPGSLQPHHISVAISVMKLICYCHLIPAVSLRAAVTAFEKIQVGVVVWWCGFRTDRLSHGWSMTTKGLNPTFSIQIACKPQRMFTLATAVDPPFSSLDTLLPHHDCGIKWAGNG